MYAITRIIPAVNNKKLLNEVSHNNIKLLHTYYSLISDCCREQLSVNQYDFELLQEMSQMVDERVNYLNLTIDNLKIILK